MKHFLFLLDELPPTQSANGICVDKIIDELLTSGHKVSCVCWGEQKKEGVHIYKIKRKPFDCAVQKLKKNKSFLNKSLLLLLRILNRVYHIFVLPWWPSESFATVRKFYKKATEVIEKDGVTDVVAVSYPGETLSAMKKIKRKYKNHIKTVMYPLDVTLFGTHHGTSLEKAISKPLNRRFMIKCAHFADKILVLENAYESFKKIFPNALQNRFFTVGIPLYIPKEKRSALNDSRDIHVAFAGNLIANVRDPSLLFELLDKIALRIGCKIYFDFYGKCDQHIEKMIYTKEHNFVFVDHGWVSEQELYDKLYNADILANIGNNSTLIPSKLFVYLSYGKPILHQCIIEEDACLYYLKQYKNACIVKEGDDRDDSALLRVENFIKKSSSAFVDTEVLFESCTPKFTSTILTEN